MIPQFEATIKFITEALEEKEREDFFKAKGDKKPEAMIGFMQYQIGCVGREAFEFGAYPDSEA